jgi:acylphosphatase
MADVRLTAWVQGRVQGVGFRWWARARALELGLTGYAENLADGRVKVLAEGPERSCRELLSRLEGGGGDGRGEDGSFAASAGQRFTFGVPGRVTSVTHRWGEPDGGYAGFQER